MGGSMRFFQANFERFVLALRFRSQRMDKCSVAVMQADAPGVTGDPVDMHVEYGQEDSDPLGPAPDKIVVSDFVQRHDLPIR